MEPLRLRLVFEDRRMLSKKQRRQGLRRSWLLLRPEVDTVAALASHIIRSFDLQHTCPRGLLLSMDNFFLPPFESSQIFKDKDVIGISRKDDPLTEMLEFNRDGNHIKDTEIMDKKPLLLIENVIAADEFENESGGYESEDEENVIDQATAMACQENSSDGKTGSKRKRKSSRPSTSKSKKAKKTRADECPIVLEHHKDAGKVIPSGKNRSSHETSSSKNQKNMQTNVVSITEDRQTEDHESQQTKAAELNANVSDKKIPSRSARRKKAKRQWLRELKNSEKKETEKSDDKEENYPVRCDDQDDHSDEEFEPIVVKPGHIRFGPAGQDEQPLHLPAEIIKWNGTVNKKKGQKWGREEDSSDGMMENDDAVPVVGEGNKSPEHLADFEKLPPLMRAPKKGDMVAYKMVELSSSWCPELSSFRVGQVVLFDPDSSKIVLDQVPGHPVFPSKRTGDDELPPDVSMYKDDGSLEIDFPSLHDVRLFDGGCTPNGEVEPMEHSDLKLISIKNKLPEREPGTAWEEINRALEEKKEELSQKSWRSGDKKKPTTGGVAWSLRVLRKSALGPTVSLLRSNNDI